MSVKLSALVICLNEEDFIGYCLNGVYDYVDEIIVVEGSVPFFRYIGATEPNGGSTDLTPEVLKDFKERCDPKKKTKIWLSKSFNSKIEMRNFALSNCAGDWILLLDADEFYHPEHLERIRHRVEGAANYGITYPHLQFWDWDMYLRGVVMERVYKKTATTKYDGNPKEGQNVYIDGKKLWGSGRTKYVTDIDCYHYSNLRRPENMMNIRRFYMARKMDIKNREEYEAVLPKIDKYIEREGVVGKDLEKAMKIFGREQIKIDPTTHPEAIKDCPLYKEFMERYTKGGNNG